MTPFVRHPVGASGGLAHIMKNVFLTSPSWKWCPEWAELSKGVTIFIDVWHNALLMIKGRRFESLKFYFFFTTSGVFTVVGLESLADMLRTKCLLLELILEGAEVSSRPWRHRSRSQTVNTILQWILDKIPFNMINFTNKYVLENWAMGLISITILAKKQYCYTAEETMSNLQLIC